MGVVRSAACAASAAIALASPPPANTACTGTSTSSRVFCPASERPRALTALIALSAAANQFGTCRQFRKRFAQFHEERADQRPGGAADLHHQRHSDRLQHFRQRFVRKAGQCRAARPRSRASCSARDRRRRSPGRGGQFVGVLDHRCRQRPHQSFPGCPIECHAATLPPAASKNSGLLRRSDTTSPAPRFASGSASVTTVRPPRSRCEMALVAEMFDPRHGGRHVAVAARDRQVLGPRADCFGPPAARRRTRPPAAG